MTALIIEWTGQGGLAESARAWFDQGKAVGRRCTVLTTLGGALSGSDVVGLERGRSMTGYAHQVDLVQLAEQYVLRNAPKVVVVMGYVMPHEEQRVADAASEVGARLVQVVYMPRPMFFSRGSSIGLRKLLRSADVLVAHSDHVADRLRPKGTQRLIRTPFPPFDPSKGVLGSPPAEPDLVEPETPQVVIDSTGVGRSELSALVAELDGDPRWTVVVPPEPDPSVPIATQYEWIRTVGTALAVVVPSTMPFGNMMTSVAMGLGAVPLVRDVGSQAEQIGRGEAGILLPEHSAPPEWRAAVESLLDRDTLERLVGAGFDLVEAQQAAFEATAREVLS